MLDGSHDGKDLMRKMAEIAFTKALKGDHKFWHDIIERADGKMPDKVEQDGKVKIEVRYVTQADDDADDQSSEADADAGEDQA